MDSPPRGGLGLAALRCCGAGLFCGSSGSFRRFHVLACLLGECVGGETLRGDDGVHGGHHPRC